MRKGLDKGIHPLYISACICVETSKTESYLSGSQTKVDTPPSGDMMGSVLGSRSQLRDGDALKWYPAETDVSIRPGWFYHESENDQVR